jgi:hypothetical protein
MFYFFNNQSTGIQEPKALSVELMTKTYSLTGQSSVSNSREPLEKYP